MTTPGGNHPSSSPARVVAPGVGVADAMSQVDWAATPVGPPEEWPSLLRSLVRVLLASKFSMWMGWGDELTFFYNDAYRRDTLGVKHPWALGRPAHEVWEEIWDVIGPRLDAVRGGDATWDEALLLFLERSGFREETYHTFSYSPISQADGAYAGVLCVVTEETERIIGERRLATLRQLASQLAGTHREEEVYAAVGSELSKNPYDLPYALVYMFNDDGSARLACAAGAPADAALAPPLVETGAAPAREGGARPAWPVEAVLSTKRTVLVEDVMARFGGAPTGAWDVPSATAVVVPLSRQGESVPAGFLVAGANPYRPVDDHAVGFVELLAGQVAAAVASARAYESERRRAEALAELDRAKTEFFSNVSHEFRTPLTLILGPAEDALHDDREPLSVPQAARLEVIRRNARRLRRLVNDMLDFARIEGGRLRAETVPTDLAELTRDVASSFAPAIERAALTLELDCRPLGRLAHIDHDMWEKILLNLLSNALKFTLVGGIRVTLREEGDAVLLSVSDTGVGIPSEHLPRLFERFYRAPSSGARSHEGTGIGLALVSELVALHEGRIEVESTEGVGATFTVRLPFGTGPTATAPARRDSARETYLDEALQWLASVSPEIPPDGRPHPLPLGRTAGATVLVADDNPDMRRYVAGILGPFWNVEVANDGKEALEMVRGLRPDLVLSDVMMPELDGFELLEALRADTRTATIPVVFLSARAGEDAAVEGLDAGADDYLVKPFSALELIARVRANLELAAMRNQEALWRTALIETLDEAVVVMDASGTVVEVNDAFERILGFPRSGLPYRPPFPWFPAEAGTVVEELFGRVMDQGRYSGTVEVLHRDGRAVQVAVVLDSVEIGGERRFVAAFRDVTAELESAERESALAQFGVRLAEAGDVLAVERAGLAELRRVFDAADAGISRDADDAGKEPRSAGLPPATTAPVPPDTAGRAVAAARAQGQVALVLAPEGGDDRAALSAAAPLDPAGPAGVVWLVFDRPRRLTADERSLFAVLCGYFGQALRRAQLFDDNRMVATAMQRSILGPTETPDGVAVRYLPAVKPLEVGGDWYDVVELPGGRLGLVVGDCVGRGLPAATVMGQLRSACRALLLQTQAPAAVVSALDTFAARIPGATCTTVFCGVLEPGFDELTYCSAGHLPGVLVGPGGAVEWIHQPGSIPLAVVPGYPRHESSARLFPGSVLVMCTDGLVERRGESIDAGLGRLAETVAGGRGVAAESLADRLMRTLVASGGREDDVAMVVFCPPQPSRTFAATLPALPAELAGLRRRLTPWLSGQGFGATGTADVLIAIGEAVSNAMEHGCSFRQERTVRVRGQAHDHLVELRVEDDGPWTEAVDLGSPERGRGIPIMRALMDRVEVRTDGGRTVVLLAKEFGDGG